MTEQERQALKVKTACCPTCGGWITQSCFPRCESDKDSIKNFGGHLKAGDIIDVITVGEAMKLSRCGCYKLRKSKKPVLPPAELSLFDESNLRPVGELVRVKAEAFEYRIYDLEIDYMMQLSDTPESASAKEKMDAVTANYHRAYPGRPLHPKRNPSLPAPPPSPLWPYVAAEKKPRKPYTRKATTPTPAAQ